MNTTIAVLPFLNLSPDPEHEYFSDGITEEIINALAQIRSLKVTSRTSSFFFKGKNLTLNQIAETLGVSVILEGSVKVYGSSLRITAQLIQAEEDFHFWSERWDRQLENIFEIQDEISLLIADKLREQFGHFEYADHLVHTQTENLDAYTLSLKAQYHFNKWNPEDIRIAISLFEKAVSLDQGHTAAYLGLADAYGFMATTEFMPREEAWRKAGEYIQRAHKLDPQNAGVQYQLANLAFFTQSNFRQAFIHTKKSIEYKANYPEARQFMAFLYILSDEMEQAWHHLEHALTIDPLSQETLFYKAYFDYRSRDYTKALAQFDSCLAQNSKNIPAYITRSYCLLKMGRTSEVRKSIESMPDEIVIPMEKTGILCLAAIIAEDKEESLRLFEQIETACDDPTAFQAHSYRFTALVLMNRIDEAFAWLEEALELKSSILLLSFSDPLVEPIKKDKRYAAFRHILYQHPEQDNLNSQQKTPLLDDEKANLFVQKLTDFIDEEEAYLDPSLSLRSLAAKIEIHPNQLSWVLNEKLGKNFNEYINHHRIAHFKQLAQDPSNGHISILGLAYESGFNSKTAFNTIFKKMEGLTPSAFVKTRN